MTDSDQNKECSLYIDGMDCPDCALNIERAIKVETGHKNTSVDFLSRTLTVKGSDVSDNQIIKIVKSLGYGANKSSETNNSAETEQSKNFLSGIIKKHKLIPVVLAGLLVSFGGVGDVLNWSETINLMLILAAIAVSGQTMFKRGFLSARRLQLDMNFLMSVAVLGALFIGEWTEAGVITVLFALSEYLEEASVNRTRTAIEQLVRIAPQMATLLRDSVESEVCVDSIVPGDEILIRPGSVIPLDGTVLSGQSSVNQAAITGESLPVSKRSFDEVLAGTINIDGALIVRVTKHSGDTTLSRIISLVKQAQKQRAPLQAYIERFARYYTPAVVGSALAVMLIPPLFAGGEWSTWIYRALALLVISCPCALVISTPVTVVSALAAAARRGVLIKGGAFLENLHRVKTMVFDKTGTVTEGQLTVKDVISLNGITSDALLQLAASVEWHSEHPIAASIRRTAVARHLLSFTPTDFLAFPGQGACAVINNRMIKVGNKSLFKDYSAFDRDIQTTLLDDLESDSRTSVLVGSEDEMLGVITLTDNLRDSAVDTIKELRREGIERICLFTGDNVATAEKTGALLGVDEVKAGMLPDDKVNAVRSLKSKHKLVSMVGDGINDAPALAASDIGIAMGGAGADATLETADIVLMSDKIERLPWVFHLSRRAHGIIVANIIFALAIKFSFILLAIMGWATLWMAVFADTGVSLLVIFNGLRVLRTK